MGSRPVVLVSRQHAIDVRASVTVAKVTGRVRGLPVEVKLTPEDGLKKLCVVNCDSLYSISKQRLERRMAALSDEKCLQVNRAIKFALGLD
jgi:mRNA-degrading endonuclease toxin of MazEF toxin-antitoxin module